MNKLLEDQPQVSFFITCEDVNVVVSDRLCRYEEPGYHNT